MSQKTESSPVNIVLFSTLFPHRGEPTLGIFVQNRLVELTKTGRVNATVIAPVPWFPFKLKMFGAYGRAALAPLVESVGDITVLHPRYLVIPKIGMMITPFTLAWSAKRQLKALLKSGITFDLIDAHYLYPDCVAAAQLSECFGIPFVATARGSDVSQIGQMAMPRRMIVDACRRASHLITVSESLKNLLVKMGIKPDKVSVLRNGVDTLRFKPVDGARANICKTTGLRPDKPIVMFAGWLIPRKRVDILIEALAHMPEVQGLIVGDGPLETRLKALAESCDVSGRVAFVGKKSPAEMAEYFSAANVFCLPSEREGWANVMLESLACGVPVVSRAVDGAVELITRDVAGRLVEGNIPKKYAEAIESVLAADYDADAVRSFAGQYGWKSTTDGQLRIFAEAIVSQSHSAVD